MAKNKVIYGNQTIIDLTDATLGQADGAKILKDETAYGTTVQIGTVAP